MGRGRSRDGIQDTPNRPSLGTLFFSALVSWGMVLVIEDLSWRAYLAKEGAGVLGEQGIAGILLACGALAVLAIEYVRRRKPERQVRMRGLLVIIVCAACLSICSALCWAAWQRDVMQVESQGGTCNAVKLQLLDDGVVHEYGTVSAARAEIGGHMFKVRLLWPQGAEPLSAGHQVSASGKLKFPEDDEGGRWNHQNGFVGMLSASSAEDCGAAPGARGLVLGFRDVSFSRVRALGGESVGLLAGILLGNRTLYRGTSLESSFQTTGLAHLMAVSGTHLAVVMALLSWVFERMKMPRLPRVLLVSVLIVAYVALTCFAPSAIRACSMCVTGLFAGSFARRPHALTALALCTLVFLALDPTAAFSLGLQLSVLAILGLVVFSPLFGAWLLRFSRGRLEGICEAVAATLAATFPTLALTVPLFAQLPLVSPLSTLLVSPVVTAALAIGIVALVVCVFVAPVGSLLLLLAGALANFCAWLVQGLSLLPGACVPVDAAAPVLGAVLGAIAIGLWTFWPLPPQLRSTSASVADFRSESTGDPLASLPERSGRGLLRVAGLVLVCLIFALAAGVVGGGGFPEATAGAEVVMLDVGQGDSTLIRDGASCMLIDTGKDATTLKRALGRQGVTHLDAIFISHKDDDHCGALSGLAGVVGVDHVYVHADLLDNPVERDVLADASSVTAGRGAEGVRVGDVARAGRFTLTLAAPQDGGECSYGFVN